MPGVIGAPLTGTSGRCSPVDVCARSGTPSDRRRATRAVDLARRRDQPAVGEQCDKCVGGDESAGGIEERSPDLGWIDAGIVKESVG